MNTAHRSKSKRRRLKTGLLLGLVVTLACTALFVMSVRDEEGLLAQVELKTLDWRFRLRGATEPDPDVVIVAIDQQSVDALGRWPWPRIVLARALRGICEGRPRVIALDIAFPLPEETPLAVMRDLPAPEGWDARDVEEVLRENDGDRLLADVLSECGNVVLGYFFLTSPEEAAHLGAGSVEDRERLVEGDRFRIVLEVPGGWRTGGMLRAHGVEPNIAALRDAANRAGFFNVVADPDGTSRRMNLVLRYRERYYPSLGLVASGAFLGEPAVDIPLGIKEYGLAGLTLAGREIPVDGAGRVLLNYRGPARTFPHVSAADVLDGTTDPDAFADKLVLLGATAVGIGDTVVAPFTSRSFPGIEAHANLVDNLIHADFLLRPDWAPAVELAALLVLGLAVTLGTMRLGPVGGPVLAAGLLLGIVAGELWLFAAERIVLGMVFPILTTISVFVAVFTAQMLTEVRARNQIKRAFARYLHPSVVERIAGSPEDVQMGGEARDITVLFCDIRGFTAVSADAEPADLVRFLNRYLDRMTGVIFRHEGLVDKFIGDAVMAFWGAPERQDDHAAKACACAREMMKKLEEFNRECDETGHPRVSIRIGISTGEAVVGNVGSHSRLDYTAIGDCVNLASRLEQSGKRYEGAIHVDSPIVEAVSDRFAFREVGKEALIEGLGETRIFSLEGPAKIND